MATNKTTRKQVKITISAYEHLLEIIRKLKAAHEPGASMTAVVSSAILALPIPTFIHEKKLAIAVDYCPQCKELVPYHNGKCQTCGTTLIHLTAITTDDLQTLMSLARLGGKGQG